MDERGDGESVEGGGVGRRLLVALAAICVLVIVGALGFAFWPAPRGASSTPPSAVEATMGPQPGDLEAARKALEGYAALPEYAPFFRQLVARLPVDAAQARGGYADRWLADRALASPERYVSDTLRALRQARGLLAAKADPGPLGRVFDSQAALLAAMAADDPRLCVDFLYGGASDAFLAFAAHNRKLFAGMAEAFLAAVLDGQVKKNDRPAPSPDDVSALERALAAAGLAKPAIDALLDGKAAEPPLPDAEMCAAGRAYLNALRAMPEDQRLRFYGLAIELMARS